MHRKQQRAKAATHAAGGSGRTRTPRARAPLVSAAPIFSRTKQHHGMLSDIAREIGVRSVQVMKNWQYRGMPFHYVDLVAPELGLTRAQYLAEAGFAFKTAEQAADYDIVTQRAGERELLANFRRASAADKALLRRIARMLAAEDRSVLKKIVGELIDGLVAAGARPQEGPPQSSREAPPQLVWPPSSRKD